MPGGLVLAVDRLRRSRTRRRSDASGAPDVPVA
jgi:hypothetical protein